MPGKPTSSTFPPEDPIERTIRAATVADDGPDATDATEGTARLGSGYTIGQLLGKGGEGLVHEAVQQAFGRPVAIKTLHAAEPGKRRLRRFRAEAAITALLEHPAIIPVHDLRNGPDGRPQLVMKRVSGKTWRALLDGAPGPLRRPLTGEEHVDVLLKVCDAIAFAHSRGILHRDLKPENVMVGEHGEVLLMDWGCAVHLGPTPPHPDIPTLAEMNGVSGTPAYLSPEQARAEHAACGPWSDVYLLGAVLYRMLTGKPPHHGEDITRTIAAAARNAPAHDPLASGIKAPPELAHIAIDAMHPDPAKRIRSADAFAAALRRYLEHREVLRLLAEGQRQHALAKSNSRESDDAYRRAISAVEQAVALWPENIEARRKAVEIGMDSAQHAIAAGAFRVAKRQAHAAAGEAERLGDGPAVDNANRLAGIADMRERQTQGREAKLAAMRKLATGGALVAGLALLVGLIAVWRESSNTTRALGEAQANLDRAETERTARVEGERLAAPALLAQARELAAQRRLPEAISLVRAAQGFAPADAAPPLMAGQLFAALGKRGEAAQSLDRALELKPDKLAEELRRLCLEPPADADLRIADVLVRMGAGAIASSLDLAAEQRATIARQRLTQAWPQLPARCISGLPDGTLAVTVTHSVLPLDSVQALRGLPISQLDLSSQDRLRDLAPLASLPLVLLRINGIAATDMTPLFGLRLRRLAAADTTFSDLTQLRGMPLEALELSLPGVATLAPLASLPLKELRLSGCDALSDITALNLLPLAVLSLDAPAAGGAALSDLGPLRGRPLRDLSLARQRGVASLAPLKGAPLVRVVLSGTAVTDLRPILGPALKSLDLGDAAVDDLRPLQGTAIETLVISPQRIRNGLAELPRIASLRSVNGLPPADFLRWVELQRAILAVNASYAWNAQVIFESGNPVELRLPKGMSCLAPLRGLPLRVLDAPDGRFSDLTPLAGMPLVQLDLRGLPAVDIAPLASLTALRRLHLARAPIADLRPLGGLQLEELTLSPGAATQGLDLLKRMSSLVKASNNAYRLLPIREFWVGVDRGDIK